jgi:hypothetical protein
MVPECASAISTEINQTRRFKDGHFHAYIALVRNKSCLTTLLTAARCSVQIGRTGQAQAGGRPAFRAMSRRGAREEDSAFAGNLLQGAKRPKLEEGHPEAR